MNKHFEIRIVDDSGDPVFHAELTCPGEDFPWRYWSEGMGGVLKGSGQSVITAIANLIGNHSLYKIICYSPKDGTLDYFPDRLGNVWHNGKYHAPSSYLPAMFSEAENESTKQLAT